MGIAESRASNFVDSEISQGFSALQTIMAQNSSAITSINEIIVGPGCKFKVDTLNMENFSKVNMSSVVSAVMSTDFAQQVQKNIKNFVDANAQAGLGIAVSDGDAVTNSITNLSIAVTQSIQNNINSAAASSNIFTCQQGGDVDIRVFNMKNAADEFLSMVTTAQQMTVARQYAVETITAEVKAKATGLDPTMLLVLIVVGAIASIGISGYVFTNPLILLGICALLTAAAAYLVKNPKINLPKFKFEVPKSISVPATIGLSIADVFLGVLAYRKFSPANNNIISNSANNSQNI
jgi:hypothetical protein